jgi:DNA-binding transcriptional ArsR family regulator
MGTYREWANLLKLMAHPVRLQILEMLRRDHECVCHLSAATGKPQPYISQQLAVMRNSGLVVDRKEGTNVYYGLANGAVGRQVTAALAGLDVDSHRGAPQGYERVAGCNCPKCAARPSRSIFR